MKFNTAFIRVCYIKIALSGIEKVFGLTPEDLNIPEALINEPMGLIPFSKVGEWFTQLEKLCQDPAFMLKIAQHLDFSKLDMPGINFLQTTDLAMCIRRINYGIASFQSGASYYIIQSGKIIKWCYRNPHAYNKQKSHDSLRVAIMLTNALRYFLGDQYRPLQLRLSGPNIAPQQVESLFECPVDWNAAQTEVWIDTDALVKRSSITHPDKPVSMPRALFEQYLDMPQPHDTPKVLFEMVNFSRYYGLPKVDDIAALFNISRQQLQRRLQRHGFNFSNLSGYILSNQAIKYMQEGKTIEEISQLLGYANKQSFSKAFKRTRHCTPQQYQDKLAP